ncbi:hypothetical protein EDD21DRAFT_361174 [Dissophora ornata]|nr:hypothetical protein EDD21DRAFT_361174 [Dissophora ornata]
MDTTGPASTVDPIACQDQLCYAKDFLPLPLPGSGKVNRNSSSNCMNGTFFSLYGTPVASGGVVRYTQSCVGQFSTGQTASCSSWEYQAQSSCFLSTCGPGMGCQQPFECRKSSTSSAAQLYGICMSPNSTEDPGDDGDQDSAKDRLIVGLLIGLCGLVLSAGIGTGFWHFRKRRLRQLRLQNGEREDDRVWNEKMSLLSALKVCCDSCFFFGGGSRRRRSDGAATARGTRHVRVVSLAESDSPENPLETDHRSNLIFARRWRWGHGQHAGAGAGVTEGGVAVLPELEPPPLYHQGPELPSYQDRNTILLTPVGPEQAHVVDHSESEGQATLPIPK